MTAEQREAADWRIASEEDSLQGYERYLRLYPTSLNAPTAQARVATGV
jgi:hypothetical protein